MKTALFRGELGWLMLSASLARRTADNLIQMIFIYLIFSSISFSFWYFCQVGTKSLTLEAYHGRDDRKLGTSQKFNVFSKASMWRD